MQRFAPWLLFLLLTGCPTEEEPLPTGPFVYEEDDDRGNNRRSLGENVGDDWAESLEIHGSLEECASEPRGGEWDYTGDLDYYDVEVTADGWIEVNFEWDQAADVDGVVRTNGERRSILDDIDDDGPEEYAPEDPHEEGDDLSIGVFCKTGEPGDYVVRVELELD